MKRQQITNLAVVTSIIITAIATPQSAKAQGIDAAFNLIKIPFNVLFNQQPRQIPNRNVGIFIRNKRQF